MLRSVILLATLALVAAVPILNSEEGFRFDIGNLTESQVSDRKAAFRAVIPSAPQPISRAKPSAFDSSVHYEHHVSSLESLRSPSESAYKEWLTTPFADENTDFPAATKDQLSDLFNVNSCKRRRCLEP